MVARAQKSRTLVLDDGTALRWCVACRRFRDATLFGQVRLGETCSDCSVDRWAAENKARLRALETGESWDVRQCTRCHEWYDARLFRLKHHRALCRACKRSETARYARCRRAARQQEARS